MKRISSIPFAVALCILTSCQTNSTSINPSGGSGNNTNGRTWSLAQMTRIEGQVIPDFNGTKMSDIFWNDSTVVEHSFRSEAKGRVGILCLGGLWNSATDAAFDGVDSLQHFYGDSLLIVH